MNFLLLRYFIFSSALFPITYPSSFSDFALWLQSLSSLLAAQQVF